MIYIASPFTHPDFLVMRLRRDQVFRYTAARIREGVVCFSPIVYGYPFFSEAFTPPDFEFWQALNDHFLLTSTEVHVLKLDGYALSRGVAHEIAFAQQNGIPVRYVSP